MRYTVNESTIDGEGDAVHNEESFVTENLAQAMTFVAGRLNTGVAVRQLEWETIMHMGDEGSVFAAFALVPQSTFEVYLSVRND